MMVYWCSDVYETSYTVYITYVTIMYSARIVSKGY